MIRNYIRDTAQHGTARLDCTRLDQTKRSEKRALRRKNSEARGPDGDKQRTVGLQRPRRLHHRLADAAETGPRARRTGKRSGPRPCSQAYARAEDDGALARSTRPQMLLTETTCALSSKAPPVSSHNFISPNFELRVSNPRIIAHVLFKMPFESSKSPRGWAHFSRLHFRKLAVLLQFHMLPLPQAGFAAPRGNWSTEKPPEALQTWPLASLSPPRVRAGGVPLFGGPETGERKRVTRKADGKLTLLVNLWGPGTKSRRFWLPISAYPFFNFSLPISGPLISRSFRPV